MLGGVCELQIPEAIDNGAATAGAIADRVGAQADATERVLRFLASRGWFARKRDGSYRLNARSRALRSNDPQSLRDWVRFMAADWHWDIWTRRSARCATGNRPRPLLSASRSSIDLFGVGQLRERVGDRPQIASNRAHAASLAGGTERGSADRQG